MEPKTRRTKKLSTKPKPLSVHPADLIKSIEPPKFSCLTRDDQIAIKAHLCGIFPRYVPNRTELIQHLFLQLLSHHKLQIEVTAEMFSSDPLADPVLLAVSTWLQDSGYFKFFCSEFHCCSLCGGLDVDGVSKARLYTLMGPKEVQHVRMRCRKDGASYYYGFNKFNKKIIMQETDAYFHCSSKFFWEKNFLSQVTLNMYVAQLWDFGTLVLFA
jgi:hypothetical protein